MFDAKDSVPVGEVPAPMYFPRAGNTVDSLRPINATLKSSERLVTEGLTTKPEPVEIAKEILKNADVLDEQLATQGKQLDRAAILEFATLPETELQTTRETSLKTTFESVEQVPLADPGHAEAWATWTAIVEVKKQIADLKESFNDSMNEVANMLLDLQTANANLEERILKYNQRGGHRI